MDGSKVAASRRPAFLNIISLDATYKPKVKIWRYWEGMISKVCANRGSRIPFLVLDERDQEGRLVVVHPVALVTERGMLQCKSVSE